MIGQTISHYKILAKLGGGGMGVVYKAEDAKLKRTVALKFLPPDLTRDDEAKERFMHEAQAASALDHPNICTIHEIDETEDGRIFICMAYYEGETLKQHVASGKLQVADVIDVAIQIAQGLAKAHEHGITHRDIKPANVMITKDGVVKIVDFGLAKLAGQEGLTKTGMTVGTVAYMSPQQAQGIEVNHRTDIWSLGVVLYEMITGQLPFRGEYEHAVIYSIMNEAPKPLAEWRAEVPAKLQMIVEKAVAKNLGERYQQTNEMLSDLRALQKELESGLAQAAGVEKRPVSSIAVLPFVNMSADPENEYFSDGLAEDLINALTKIKGFHVAARTSAFSFKGEKQDIREIGRKLNVETVLEGSVRKVDDRLRITAQLINVSDGYHLWSERYDRVMADVFAIQDEITLAIVNALKVELLGEEKAAIAKRYTDNLEAYNLYLKGRYFWNKRFEGGLQKAMEYFKQAIEKEPTYALAYSGLADCLGILGFYSYLPPQEAFPKAKALAQKALEIDDSLAEAHTSMAGMRWVYDWNWLEAEQEFKRALELKPSYAMARWWYSYFLMTMGRTDESLAEIKQAQEFDPLSLVINTMAGWMLYFAHQYDQAIAQCQKALEMDPNFGMAHFVLGWAYEQEGMYEEAIAVMQKAKNIVGLPLIGPFLAHVYAISGKTDEAQKLIDQLNELLSKQQYVSPCHMAVIHAGLGEQDQAFEWLQKAYKERAGWLIMLKVEPRFDSLRSDPRYTELLKKVGLEK